MISNRPYRLDVIILYTPNRSSVELSSRSESPYCQFSNSTSSSGGSLGGCKLMVTTGGATHIAMYLAR
jgi:hypothetical protein